MKTKKKANFKNMQIVVVEWPKGLETSFPFKNGDSLLFLGEIPNMPGHCAVVNRDGQVLWGYHLEDFRHPTDEEI